jgi:hypothetical protein
MACGEQADTCVSKNFSWYPQWLNLLILFGIVPWLIVTLILTKRKTVDVPFCERHHSYFMMRILWQALILTGTLAAWIVPTLLIVFGLKANNEGEVAGFVCSGFVLAIIVCIVGIAIIQGMTIKPVEITDRSITLVKVSPTFADALREMREQDELEDNQEKKPRRRRDEIDDDVEDDRPPRRSDAYRGESPRRGRRSEDEE